MAQIKNSVERYNIDDALAAFDNNQFQFVLGAAVRAREIATNRTIAERNGDRTKYENRPVVAAVVEFAEGKVGKEYLNKVNTRKKG